QCQNAGGDRVVCYGAPGSNPQIEVGLVCDAHGVFDCQPGSQLQFSGGECVSNFTNGPIGGMDGWEANGDGVPLPVNGIPLPDGARAGPVFQNQVIINGVMVAESLTNGESSSGTTASGESGSASNSGSGWNPVCTAAGLSAGESGGSNLLLSARHCIAS